VDSGLQQVKGKAHAGLPLYAHFIVCLFYD